MSTYAIGDVQGCFDELKALLAKIHFDEDKDTLWFTGDLVNRGPKSLEVLRFIKGLGEKHQVVLGNHDLHLLALAKAQTKLKVGDTLEPILKAADCQILIEWLRKRSLLYHDKKYQCVLVHAGLAPTWTLHQAKLLAQEVEKELNGPNYLYLLKNMYGNLPDRWEENLAGIERWRVIINYLTRLRFCHPDGRIDLSYKGELLGKPKELIPWFLVPDRANASEKIIFGHWAALGGKANAPDVFPLDTGCVWGNCLTAFNVETKERITVKCG